MKSKTFAHSSATPLFQPHALTILLLLSAFTGRAAITPFGTEFTYQGRLSDASGGVSGHYDFRFALQDAPSGGTNIVTVTNMDVAVSNGLFTTQIDFGSGIFIGYALWLDIGVRTNGSAGAFTALSPRVPLTPSPYAIMANSASNLLGLLPAGQLSGTLQPGQLAGSYANAVSFSNAADSFSGSFAGNGLGVSNVNAAALGGFGSSNFWNTAGNAGTAPGLNFLGTTDNQPLELKVNNSRVLRLEPNTLSPNVIGGHGGNYVSPGVVGAFIGGGGSFSGGQTNTVSANGGAIAGGFWNTVRGLESFIGGGNVNTVGGRLSVIGGGNLNSVQANSDYSTIAGGHLNMVQSNADHSVISGGLNNTNRGPYAVVAGGDQNLAGTNSFAAGHRAKASHTGSFVWADSTDADFATSSSNQFLIRAAFTGVNRSTPVTSAEYFGVQAPVTTGYGGMYIETSGANAKPFYGYAQAGGITAYHYVDGADANKWKLHTGGFSDAVVVTAGGNVGVGTDNPQSALHVAGTATADNFNGSAAALGTHGRLDIYGASPSNPSISLDGSASKMAIFSSGLTPEKVRLGLDASGVSGELVLRHVSTNIGVTLTANAVTGAELFLNSANGSGRAWLSGANGGGFLNLDDGAGGNLRITGSGAVQSSADSYVFVPGTAFPQAGGFDAGGGAAVLVVDCAGNPGLCPGTVPFACPITVPAVLYGQPVTVKSVTIYYKCLDANSLIVGTQLVSQLGVDNPLTLYSDSIPHTNTAPDSYVVVPTANNVLSSDQGILELVLSIHSNSSTDNAFVKVGGVRVQLGHQ